ncbi:acyltransferase family protein [Enteractinococcus coprophilus]|uniref:Peptidoglycan/LPS O-acetylase OafA/YrhL n=1 Tax=Enteractinococcus coprophilus TaxID=1027633 RepID=A0A543AIL8_9MICC|nr:acyltransferase family protein [Enteractinococcus coprophilus]TQL72422.1 peptidoglycan/LPS O-acetylase OafA/YrhL [Enteractinococcus coprophilus]
MTTQPPQTSAPIRGSFRLELQGLRALAVGLVLLFHLWPHHISGGFVGVDVFFVVSGFLITGHLYRELSQTGRISLSKFWARRVMRLLPLAFTVLVISFIAMLVFLPQTVWSMNVRQLLGSLFYIENWVLAADSVDYMAADNEPSLVQHYWSLSIEEQFYVLLPLIFVGIYLLTKHRGDQLTSQQHARQVIIWSLTGIIVLSFIFSVGFTNYNPAQAYFVTPTRFWEFATGGLLAMLPATSRIPTGWQNVLGWAGIVAIVIAGLLYSGETPFPGYTALLPVLGAALFIRYGSHQPGSGVYWWASLTPSVRMGDWSYAIYLWHWPLIIVATYQLEPFLWYQKLVIIVVTFVLSAASQKLVEDPLRRAKPFKVPRRAFTLMASNMALIAAVTFFIPQVVAPETHEEIAVSECVGADAFLSDCEELGTNGEPKIPATQVQVEAEEPTYPECNIPDGYTNFDRSGCSLGAPEDSAALKIAVIGDSHARAWLPLFDELGRENNWNIQGYTKSGCTPVPLSSAAPGTSGAGRDSADACAEFVVNSSEDFQHDAELDLIVTAAAATDRDFYGADGESSESITTQAVADMWSAWKKADKEVLVMGELPHFNQMNVPTCVASNPGQIAEECSQNVEGLIGDRGTILADTALQHSSSVKFYDPTPGLCDDQRCYSMVGGLITRYDHHHVSSDFARSYSADFMRFLEEHRGLDL